MLAAQQLEPTELLKKLGTTGDWATYGGDYTGRRYSSLTQLNQTTVKSLTLAWSSKLMAGTQGRKPGPGLIVSGIGTLEANALANIKGSPLQVDGIIYVSTPDNAWAMDARDGHEIWHYVWKTRGGTHIGNRGLAMWHSRLYMETPDDVLICLDAKTGKEIWHKDIADFDLQYFSTPAPIVVGNHILVGTGNDLDMPGYLQSFDPETGDVQWKFYPVPMKKGDPGLETWANRRCRAARRRQHVGSGLVRSRHASLHRGHRQSIACLHHRHPRQWRQPVYVFRGRHQRRDRKDRLVLPDLAARHSRLGFGADADSGRWRIQWPPAQDGAASQPQRLLLHAGSPHR